jgi:hypothetical protein
MDAAPTTGNALVATMISYGDPVATVASITQTGVTWTLQVAKTHDTDNVLRCEIWYGVVGSGASNSLTVNLSSQAQYGAVVDVCEYSGLMTSGFLDKTATASGWGSSTSTGTTATTSQANELWIGCTIHMYPQPSPQNGFTLLDGAKYTWVSNAYLEKMVTATGQAYSGTVPGLNTDWVGCIATFKASSGTIVVPYDGRYAGVGSKQTTVWWNGADTIMQVQSNVPSNLNKSAVIENLIIDGTGSTNATGILLENVYNCYIRNVTIKNCDVGIKVRITGSNWSHANRFEHIRMINVKTGILFTGTSSNKDFSFTTIDDVGISLKNDSVAVGIKVGDPYANLYNTFIKATIWLDTSNGTGMVVNGELKLSLVNLEVEEPSQSYNGKGLQINSGAYVTDNQNFLLTTGGIKDGDPYPEPDYRVINNGTKDDTLTVRSF